MLVKSFLKSRIVQLLGNVLLFKILHTALHLLTLAVIFSMLGEAVRSGIPLAINITDKDWLNFRSTYFTRKRKRDVDNLARYGGVENLNAQGKAPAWKAMLKHSVEHSLGVFNEEQSHDMLKVSGDGFFHLVNDVRVRKIDAEKLCESNQGGS